MSNKQRFQADEETTAQLGNPFDSHGYQEHAPIKILAARDDRWYLIEIAPNVVGLASDPTGTRNEGFIQGELYCTCAMSFGHTDVRSEIAQSWGFNI